MGRGSLIVFEGCDKSGKSTQCKRLVETLLKRGVKAEGMRYPERSTDIGQVITKYIEKKCELDDRAVHLLFSANRWEFMPEMKKKLMAGTTLVVDRYAYSGVAFTAAKGYTMDWLKTCDSGLIEPDAVFFMDIPVSDASERGDFGDERYEVGSFQQTVQEKFKQLREPWWRIIDARGEIEAITNNLEQKILQVITESENQPLKTLWSDEKVILNGS